MRGKGLRKDKRAFKPTDNLLGSPVKIDSIVFEPFILSVHSIEAIPRHQSFAEQSWSIYRRYRGRRATLQPQHPAFLQHGDALVGQTGESPQMVDS